MTPKDLYSTCRFSAFRLETQQHYEVPGDEDRQRAFHAGESLPPPRDELLDDLRLIANLNQRGRRIGRVHVVNRPLTPYLRYELAVYAENVAAGEDVRIADRSQHPGLAALRVDFVISDMDSAKPAVIVFDYDENGHLHGYRRVAADSSTGQPYRHQFALALGLSVPLAEFMSAIAV